MFKTFIFFLAIMINTIFRCLFLYVFALLRWVPIEIFKKYFFVKIVKTGENWVATNNLVIDTLTKTRFEIIQEKELNFSKTKSYLIISNHRSWVDILVLQRIFNKQVPFLRFFIKQELKWIPFLGLAFKILDFPFMKRYTK
ncbi:MAG: 1-acyl-sn-glycerol-3-phosphate acyltransferase, partial [Bdellovibrionales bacterium]|nr:1-acyl-sn-glycerol-3-phosphate acyltransferase [Bdellovibrionales bacterium]